MCAFSLLVVLTSMSADTATVLVLDDDESILEATQSSLQAAGYRAITLTSPFLLFKTLERERPEIVLLDTQMPALDGERVLEIAHGIGAFRDVLVFLFADDEPNQDLQTRAASHGASGVVRKRSSVDDLRRHLARSNGRRRPAPVAAGPKAAPARVVVDVPDKLSEKLQSTLIWRAGIERLTPNGSAATVLRLLRTERPRMLILDGRAHDAPDLISRIRGEEDLRQVSIAALLDMPAGGCEGNLRKAGANIVLYEWQSTPIWDRAFQELLSIPARRWARFPVRVTVGAMQDPAAEVHTVEAENISVRGILVEGHPALARDAVVHLFFRPETGPELHAVGRVVWEAPTESGALRHGIEFIGFHHDAQDRVAAFAPPGAVAVVAR
jgi:CheY-like chemotaxis protein